MTISQILLIRVAVVTLIHLFSTLDELKDAVLGYNFFYNAHRPHQGLGGKKPQDMLNMH